MFSNVDSFLEKERPDAREFGDWTRKGPLPDSGAPRRTSDRGGFGSGRGGFDNASDAGGDRPGRRAGYEQGDGKVRDFGNWDRKGPLTPTLPAAAPARSFERPMSRDGPAGRRNSPSWGEGRSDAGSRPPRREFVERPAVERAPTAAEQDTQWRAKMKPDPSPAPPVQPVQTARSPALSYRELSTPPSPAAMPSAPASRPKLNLAKRTVSEAPLEATPNPASESKTSPFGTARPIDTATREKEVEEKRQQALREKKEAEEKARAEKKVADEKTKEEKRLAKEAEIAAKKDEESANKEKPNGQPKERTNGQPKEKQKENGASGPQPGKSYEILRRAANDDKSAADEEAEEANGDGLVTGDKAVKPQEIVRDIQSKEEAAQPNGASVASKVDPSAEALENDGWSTVSKPVKGRKNNNQAARAIAS